MIGIFGDSFGHEVAKKYKNNEGTYSENPGTHGWPTILSELYNEEIENFSWIGTSVYYSYDEFCKQDLSKYSKVIFISTEPGRQHFVDKKLNRVLLWNGRGAKESIDMNNAVMFQEKFNMPLLEDSLRVLKYQEYISAMYPDTWECMARAIDRDILHSHENVLLLHTKPLCNIDMLDRESLGRQHIFQERPEFGRECHMSRQQNIELAGYIKDYFDNGFDIHTAIMDAKDNFTISKTLQDAGLGIYK